MKLEIYRENESSNKRFKLVFSRIFKADKAKLDSVLSTEDNVQLVDPKLQIDIDDVTSLTIEFNQGKLENFREATQFILTALDIAGGKISCYDLWKLYPTAPDDIANLILRQTLNHAATTNLNSMFSSSISVMRSAIAEYEANKRGYTLFKQG